MISRFVFCFSVFLSACFYPTLIAAPDDIAGVVTLPAPGARCMIQSDRLSLLVIGTWSVQGGQLQTYALDGRGQPSGEPNIITLPRAEPLSGLNHGPVSLAFHPTLPLLYAWQDVAGTDPRKPPPADLVHKHLDHLLIYEVNKDQLKLVDQLARGPAFGHGFDDGTLATNATGDRLYLPNLRRVSEGDASRRPAPVLGFASLDAKGRVVIGDDGVRLFTQSTRGLIDPAQSHPWGIIPASDSAVIVGAPRAVMTWEIGQSPVYSYMFMSNAPGQVDICAHPDQPLVFATTRGGSLAYRVRHAHGYVTMVPQSFTVSSVRFTSAPVVLSGRQPQAVAAGAFGATTAGGRFVALMPLDDQGRYTGKLQTLTVGGAVRALAYSPKFDRLYVPVEEVDR